MAKERSLVYFFFNRVSLSLVSAPSSGFPLSPFVCVRERGEPPCGEAGEAFVRIKIIPNCTVFLRACQGAIVQR